MDLVHNIHREYEVSGITVNGVAVHEVELFLSADVSLSTGQDDLDVAFPSGTEYVLSAVMRNVVKKSEPSLQWLSVFNNA